MAAAPAQKKNTKTTRAKSSSQKTRSKKPKGTIQFHLTWSGLISWGVFAVVVAAWAFILGILVGRGYHPESFVPLVADFMPGEQVSQEQKSKDQSPVLSAQELGFYESLDSEGRQTSPANARSRERAQSDPRPSANAQKKRSLDQTVYVYRYQVGAFKKRNQARTLQAHLDQVGIGAEVERSTVQGTAWYRVLVQYTGTPAGVQAFTSKLHAAGVSSFFLRSKREG